MFHARDQNMHGQVPVLVSRFVPWGRKSLWLLNLLCVALQGGGAAPSALSGQKHFINHSPSQAALTLAAGQDHQGILWVGEESQGAWMAAAASLDRIPSLSAQKILTRCWCQAETSGIVEGHCLNCCYKVMCGVLAVLTTFTLICESNVHGVVHPLW